MLNTTQMRYKFIWPTHNKNIMFQVLDTQIKCGLFLSLFFVFPAMICMTACVSICPIGLLYTGLLCSLVIGQTVPWSFRAVYVTTKKRCIPTESDTSSNKADLKELLQHHVPNAGIEVQITGSVFPVFLHFSLSLCISNPTNHLSSYSDGAPLCCEEEMEDLGARTVCAEWTEMQKKVWENSNLVMIKIALTISGF